jgi:polysaccharide biosynthesis transport protein
MNNYEKPGLPETPGLNLRDLLAVIQKRRGLIIAVALTIFATVTLVSWLTVPTYTATGEILIEREPNILSFEDVFQIESFNDDYYQTQYKLLLSRALAGDTIDRMKLDQNRDFVKAAIKDGENRMAELIGDPIARGQLINEFLGRLSVRPVRKTRLVQASFSDVDPKLAADVLNELFAAYIEMNVRKKYQATEKATDFLANQIQSVRDGIEVNEKKLQEYSREKNIIALNSSENTVINKLGELNKALTDAQIDRINKQSYYNEIRVATPDYIPNTMSNPLIQKLQEEYTRLYRDYMKRSEMFLPEYPEIQSLKAELEAAKKALEDETQTLIKRALTDYQSALAREQALIGAFNSQRSEAFQLNSNAIQYNSLLIQIQNEKSLLESLMKRKSETDLSSRLKDLRTSNIWIVDKAEIPQEPSSPHRARNMAVGLLAGIIVGLALVLVLENLDNTVKDSEDVKKIARLPILGTVPAFSSNGKFSEYGEVVEEGGTESKRNVQSGLAMIMERVKLMMGLDRPAPPPEEREELDLIVHLSPKSSFAEYYRSIRTSLLFSTDATRKAIAIMSPLPQDGKTVTSCNMAIVLAQTGKKVLLIDADLRKPGIHKVFGVKNLNGLTKYLSAGLSIEDMLHATPIPTLFLINAGPVPPNPLELLGSEKAATLIGRLKEEFDFIIVDTPPILPVSDALVLGRWLEGAILVVRAGRTPKDALKQAQEKIAAHQIKNLGVVINDVRIYDFEEYHGSPYYRYKART